MVRKPQTLADFGHLVAEFDSEKNKPFVPDDYLSGSMKKVWWRCERNHYWEATVQSRTQRGTGCPYCSNVRPLKGFNTLGDLNPEVLGEWNFARNATVSPEGIVPGSGKKVWWICGQEHEYEMVVSAKAQKGFGCPYCSGQKTLSGFNDLATHYPDVAGQWSERNHGRSPHNTHWGSNKKAWWKCQLGHEWEAVVASRTRGNTGCPYCSNNKLLVGFNDLETMEPELAKEWATDLNDLLPSSVMPGSPRKAWWRCGLGHEWEAQIASRANGTGCPFCSNRRVLKGFNDLATLFPEVSNTWSSKNLPVEPGQVLPGTSQKFLWNCARGHEYEASVHNRVKGTGCSYCAGKKVLPGFNDFASRDPVGSKYWHPSRNEVLPNEVTSGSNKSYWFLCDEGHEYQNTPAALSSGKRCGICSGNTVIAGINDLATQNPELAEQWHPKRNGKLSPAHVTGGSGQKIWWLCPTGHEWQAPVFIRRRGIGCPICVNRLTQSGVNDLALTHPELAADWHPTRNGELSARDVQVGALRTVWWLCQEGHEWRASLHNRRRGTGCPTCADHGFDPEKPAIIYFLRNKEFGARKVGITGQATTRLKKFERYGWELISTFELNEGHSARQVETEFFRWLRNEHGVGVFLTRSETRETAGWTETFSDSGLADDEVLEKLQLLIAEIAL